MKTSILRTLALFTSTFGIGQSNELQFEFVTSEINGIPHRGIEFQTETGLLYQVKASSDLKEWTKIAEIEGFDDSLTYPFLKIPTQSAATPPAGDPPPEEPVVPNVSVVFERLPGNGTLLSWKSLDSVGLTRHHAPNLTLSSNWDSIPFYFHAGTDYSYFLLVGPYSNVQPPAFQNILSTNDYEFVTTFLADFANIQNEAFQNPQSNAVLVAPSLGDAKFFKVEAVISDRDRDGIPDSHEIPIDQGGTGSSPNDPDSDADGVWDGPEVALNSDPNSDQETPLIGCFVNPPSDGDDETHVGSSPLSVEIMEIGFHQNLKMTSDLGTTNYDDPHCVRGSHSYPVAYVRGETMSLSGLFKIEPTPDVVFVQAAAPGGISLSAELVSAGDNLWKLNQTRCTGTLPETVKFYNAQDPNDPDKAFELSWTVAASFGTKVFGKAAGSTRHTLYLTYEKPIQPFANFEGPRQETLFNIGCRKANGQSDNTSNSIANLIYEEFTDQEVARVVPMQGVLRNDDALTYYGEGTSADDRGGEVSTLLRSGDGACGGFASFLNHLFRIQGISANITEIKPVHDAHFLLHKYNFIDAGTLNLNSNGQTYPFKWPSEVVDVPGWPAQGNKTPRKRWGPHLITESNGFFYDPSYGRPQTPPSFVLNLPIISPIPFPDIKAFEDFNVVGFHNLIGDQNGARKNDTSADSPSDLQYQFIPSLN